MTVLRVFFSSYSCGCTCVNVHIGGCVCACVHIHIGGCMCVCVHTGGSICRCMCVCMFTLVGVCVCTCSYWWVHCACRRTWMPAADADKLLLSWSTFLFLKILSRKSRAFWLEVQASLHTWTIFHVGFRHPNASSLAAGQELQLLNHLSHQSCFKISATDSVYYYVSIPTLRTFIKSMSLRL